MNEDTINQRCATCTGARDAGKDPVALTRRGFVSIATWSMITAALAACGGDAMTGLQSNGNNGLGGGGGNNSPPAGVAVSGNHATIDLTQATELAGPQGFLIIPTWPGIVIHLDDGSYRAFTAICTHEGCTVSNFSDGLIFCPCHGSTFNTSGLNVGGPAPSPLQSFSVAQDGTTTLTVTMG